MNITERYRTGELIPANEFNSEEGMKLFGNVVWLEHGKDHATAQYGLFDSEVYWQKSKPLQCSKHEFLKRPTEEQIRQERGSRRLI